MTEYYHLTAELFERFKLIMIAPVRKREWPPSEADKNNYLELLKVLEHLTCNRRFLAGDEMSIAGISFICDLTVLTNVLGISTNNVVPCLVQRSERMRTELPKYEESIMNPMIELRNVL